MEKDSIMIIGICAMIILVPVILIVTGPYWFPQAVENFNENFLPGFDSILFGIILIILGGILLISIHFKLKDQLQKAPTVGNAL